MRRDCERHRLINIARAQTYSDIQMRNVIFTYLKNVSKCACATKLKFLIISINFDSNLDHFYSLDSFGVLRELIICRTHSCELLTNLHIWTENLILFHRSVIWAENCHKWIITSNDWFHFSVFSAFRTLSLSAEHFRHENY